MDNGEKHVLLLGNIEIIVGENFHQRVFVQMNEEIPFEETHEMIDDVLESGSTQGLQRIQRRQLFDLYTVVDIDLQIEEFDQQIRQLLDGEHHAGIEHFEEILVTDICVTGVDEFEDAFHRPRSDILDANVAFGGFTKVIGEHRTEIGRCRGENQPVTGEGNAVDIDGHISEEIGETKLIDRGEQRRRIVRTVNRMTRLRRRFELSGDRRRGSGC